MLTTRKNLIPIICCAAFALAVAYAFYRIIGPFGAMI
jgi:hypothetical protein